MAELIWSGTRMFTSLGGDKEVARSHKRDARILIGYLLGTTSDLRPYTRRVVRLADGTVIQAHVWRGDGVARAKVRIWSPRPPLEEGEPIIYSLVLFIASNTATAGYDDNFLPLPAQNNTICPVWEWTPQNKLIRLAERNNAWDVQLKKIAGENILFSLGKAMFYPVGSSVVGTVGSLRKAGEIIAEVDSPVYDFCVRTANVEGEPTLVALVATSTTANVDLITIEFRDSTAGTVLGTATINGLQNWGENQDTAYVKHVQFSPKGEKIAILVSMSGPSGPDLYGDFSDCAVFQATITAIQPNSIITATVVKEPFFSELSTTISTDTVWISDATGDYQMEYVTAFTGTGKYETPFMFSWKKEELTTYSIQIQRALSYGYVAPPDNTYVATDNKTILWGCIQYPDIDYGVYVGWYQPTGILRIERSADDDAYVFLKVNDTAVESKQLLQYLDLTGGLGGGGGTGGVMVPDIAGEQCGPAGPSEGINWLDAYDAMCDLEEYWYIYELSYFQGPCTDAWPTPVEWDLQKYGTSIVNDFWVSPQLCVEGKAGWIDGHSVTTDFYADWIQDAMTPTATVTQKTYVDDIAVNFNGKRLAIGQRPSGEIKVGSLLGTEAQFKTLLKSMAASRFLTAPSDVSALAHPAGKTAKKELITVMTANNTPNTVVRAGESISLQGGGALWHSAFGHPPDFPLDAQACYNAVLPDFYAGTITNLDGQV